MIVLITLVHAVNLTKVTNRKEASNKKISKGTSAIKM